MSAQEESQGLLLKDGTSHGLPACNSKLSAHQTLHMRYTRLPVHNVNSAFWGSSTASDRGRQAGDVERARNATTAQKTGSMENIAPTSRSIPQAVASPGLDAPLQDTAAMKERARGRRAAGVFQVCLLSCKVCSLGGQTASCLLASQGGIGCDGLRNSGVRAGVMIEVCRPAITIPVQPGQAQRREFVEVVVVVETMVRYGAIGTSGQKMTTVEILS